MQRWQYLALEPNALNAERRAWLLEAVTHERTNPTTSSWSFWGMRCCGLRPANSSPPPIRDARGRPLQPQGQLVSDRWLAELETLEIERWWRIGPKASGDSTAAATIARS